MGTVVQSASPLLDRDRALAARIAAGDTAAFAALMRTHNRSLFRVSRAILKDPADAEDALQEAYFSAYRGMHRFAGEARLSTWLTRIVINEALGRLRRRKADTAVDTSGDGARGPGEEDVELTDTRPNPEAAAGIAQVRLMLERKLDELAAGFRSVFVLREIEGFSVQEVAASLGIPEATVRSRLFRAKSLLRDSIARELGGAWEDVYDFGGARCDLVVAQVLDRIAALATIGP